MTKIQIYSPNKRQKWIKNFTFLQKFSLHIRENATRNTLAYTNQPKGNTKSDPRSNLGKYSNLSDKKKLKMNLKISPLYISFPCRKRKMQQETLILIQNQQKCNKKSDPISNLAKYSNLFTKLKISPFYVTLENATRNSLYLYQSTKIQQEIKPQINSWQ